MTGTSNLSRGRREYSRIRVNLPAMVCVNGRQIDTTMTDISISGARVLHEGPLAPGQTMTVEWVGERAMGRIVWFDGSRCGVDWFERIEPRALLATRDAHIAARDSSLRPAASEATPQRLRA